MSIDQKNSKETVHSRDNRVHKMLGELIRENHLHAELMEAEPHEQKQAKR